MKVLSSLDYTLIPGMPGRQDDNNRGGDEGVNIGRPSCTSTAYTHNAVDACF